METLSPQQKLFVEAYAGDEVEAARIAGYRGEPHQLLQRGKALLRNPKIAEAIKNRSKYKLQTEKAIATREERQAFWTSLMRNEDPHAKPSVDPKSGMTLPPDPNVPLATRIKASELLGKSEADFMDRVEHSGDLTLMDIVSGAHKLIHENPEEIEDAQFEELPRKLPEPEEQDSDPDPIEDLI